MWNFILNILFIIIGIYLLQRTCSSLRERTLNNKIIEKATNIIFDLFEYRRLNIRSFIEVGSKHTPLTNLEYQAIKLCLSCSLRTTDNTNNFSPFMLGTIKLIFNTEKDSVFNCIMDREYINHINKTYCNHSYIPVYKKQFKKLIKKELKNQFYYLKEK